MNLTPQPTEVKSYYHNIWRRVQFEVPYNVFLSVHYYFPSLKSKYCSEHPVLKLEQRM